MRFEIVVAPPASDVEPLAVPPSAIGPGPHAVVRGRPGGARELLDVFIDGTNVTARARETHGAFVLRDLALALVELSRRTHAKQTVRFYDEPWEMCVERFGASACISVYRAGPEPQVTAYDHAVPFDGVVGAVLDAIDRLLTSAAAPGATGLELASAAQELRGMPVLRDTHPAAVPEPTTLLVEPDHDAHLSFGAVFTMRSGHAESHQHADDLVGGSNAEIEPIERADLHALLFRGRVRAQVRGRVVDLGDCHPLLVAEQIIELARRAFDAYERGLAMHARGEAAGVLVGMRVATDGRLALTLGAAPAGIVGGGPAERRTLHTFPALGASDVLDAALAFGRALVRAILRHDRSQSSNLRLAPLRQSLREANESLREASQTDSKVNPTPEPYRAFVAALDETRANAPSALPAGRLRYAPRWRAVVPGIDLRATYLCGDRLIVSSATEMWALDRATGRSLWRTDIPRGASIITPNSVTRLAPDGSVRIYDVYSGEVSVCTRISPRTGGPLAGAAVNLPGLPRLIVVTEGAHYLVAIDLSSGEARWRWSWSAAHAGGRHGRGIARVKRAGRLAYFTCGDGALTALDVMTGAVVWRLRDRLRFHTPPAVTHDALFVVAGGAHGIARLYRVDPYSGSVRWSTAIGETHAPCTVEGAPIAGPQAVAVTLRHKGGLALAPFHGETGTPVAGRMRVVGPRSTSWLAVDDTFVGNAPNGELVAIDAASGDLRWRQVLGPSPLEADVPRRLEPVLRCGALFVPHADVVVVRPRDGAVLGAISPTEAIPDLLRVDERCDVYIAEESGHILAFGALPRLSLVKD
jgi:outer membrane protein assembly factor BamB